MDKNFSGVKKYYKLPNGTQKKQTSHVNDLSMTFDTVGFNMLFISI